MLQTRNWRESGQANLLKRLMAIHCPLSSFALYTTLGAFSPCSDTMFSEENPFVAVFSCSKLNSPKLGHNFLSFFSPFSAAKTTLLKDARLSRQRMCVWTKHTKTKNNINLGQRTQGQKAWGGSGTSRKRI